ncbi:MAG: hypothetical protein ACKESB_03290 [Candidatus Hodgkinia cicadicola]
MKYDSCSNTKKRRRRVLENWIVPPASLGSGRKANAVDALLKYGALSLKT